MAGLVLDGGSRSPPRSRPSTTPKPRPVPAPRPSTSPPTGPPARSPSTPPKPPPTPSDYLASTGHTGTVTVNGEQVTVTVSITQPMQILYLAGIDHLTVTGTGTATAEQNGEPA